MKSKRGDIRALILLALVSNLFFFRLFWPTPRLIVTPDFGASDAWHASYAMKYALFASLKEGALPLWNSQIGGGFPLLAEGQVGALFLPNLLLFSLNDPVSAYNLSILATILIMGSGMYLWMRTTGLGIASSWMAGITLSFSGLSIAQLTHLTLLQGMSLFPWMAMATCWLTTKPRWGIVAWVLLGSQQLFTGFPQGVLITWIFCTAYITWMSVISRSARFFIYFVSALLLTLGIGSAQLFPSIEFLRESQFYGGFDLATATFFSFPLKHLATAFAPFALGSPKDATYPYEWVYEGSVFWENIAYIGIVPLLLATWGIWKFRHDERVRFFSISACISLLLALGRHSPFYFLYGFFPLTLFRVPSRFLWLSVAAVIGIAAYSMHRLTGRNPNRRKQIFLFTVIVFHVAALMAPWWDYHAMKPAADWIRKPRSSRHLSGEGRTFTIGSIPHYSAIVRTKGWGDMKPFAFIESGIVADSNVLWDIPHLDVKAGRYVRRQSIANTLLMQTIETSPQGTTVSAAGTTLLNLFSVRNIYSFSPVITPKLREIYSDIYDETLKLTLYDNPGALPRAYLVSSATSAGTLTEAVARITDPAFEPQSSVMLETHEIAAHPELAQFLSQKNRANTRDFPVTVTKDTDMTVELATPQTDSPKLLVMTDTYYPGWKAYVDSSRVPIFAANLTQRAIVVPAGVHKITFRYEPESFRIGITVSTVSLIVTALLMAVRLPSAGFRTA